MKLKAMAGLAIISAGLCCTAQAADGVWNVDADGAWSNSANWVGGTVAGDNGNNNTDTATFSTTLTADRTVAVDDPRAIGLVEFGNTSAFGYTLDGGELRINGAALPTSGGLPGIRVLSGAGAHDNIINSAIQFRGVGNRSFTFSNDSADAGLTIDGNIQNVVGAGRTFTINLEGSSTAASIGGVNNQITGIINDDSDGTVAVVKNGAGLWTLTGNNSFEGGLVVNEGTIRYFGAGRRNFGLGTVTINDGVSFQKANTSIVLVENDMVVNGDFQFFGNSAGNLWQGDMDLTGGERRIDVDADLTLSGTISNGTLFVMNGSANLTLTGSSLVPTNRVASGTLTVAADNVFANCDRIQVINSGTLVLTNGTAFIGDACDLAITGPSATLAMDFTGTDTVHSITLDGVATLSPGTYSAADLTVLGSGTYTGTGFLAATTGGAGYDAWESSYGVSEGRTGDDDNDGLLNVYEYGLGGDPTNAMDQGIAPMYVADAGGFTYIHPQLSDANSGITYHLELNTDLVSGIWTNAGYTVDGTNIVAGDFDFATNTTTTTEDKKFIRLIIE